MPTEDDKIIDTETDRDETADSAAEQADPNGEKQKKPRGKRKLSGSYWYSQTDETELVKQAFNRTLSTVIATLLQFVVLIFPQDGLKYVTENIPSYAYVYMWIVFVFIGTAVYVNIMNAVRYKFQKRIPVEHAPKSGFKRRAFLGTEIFMILNGVIFILELSFVCIHFDGWGLAGVFVAALAVAAAVFSRIITVRTLGDSVKIESK